MQYFEESPQTLKHVISTPTLSTYKTRIKSTVTLTVIYIAWYTAGHGKLCTITNTIMTRAELSLRGAKISPARLKLKHDVCFDA